MPLLLIVDTAAAVYVAELEQRSLPRLEIRAAATVEQGRELAAEAEIILGQPDLVAPLLSAARKLQWVQSTFAGIEPLCADQLRRDYLLTGVKEIFGPLMSEYVFAHILARERHLIATRLNQQQKNWLPLPYRSLTQLTIGIAGLGSIGQHLAGTAAHFGMRVLGLKRTAAQLPRIERLFLHHERSAFLAQLDYLVLALPATAETKHFIGWNQLSCMKESAILINVGRGAAVDQQALVEALQRRMIGGAILDVFEQEPLPADSVLWEVPEVVITPHNSAVSFPDQVARIFADNYLRFLGRQPLHHLVDLSRGY